MTDPKRPPDDDPDEVEYLHKEIQRDLAKGEGAKHFEQELDELHSKTLPDPIDLERVRAETYNELRQFSFALKRHVTNELLPQGLKCEYVELDEDNLTIACKDAQKRQHEVQVPLDHLLQAQAMHGHDPRAMMSHVVEKCCQALLNARAHYFKRMGHAN